MPQLPAHLAERLAPFPNAAPRDGAYVIYWMRVAVRAVENPALDVALHMGAALKLPVFVYHALSERYPYASDRHHTFILEGARDVQAALRARGIGHAFHLERPGHRGQHLKALAQRAALVVTEDFPVAPFTTWDAQLSRVAPLWRVDASCVAPFRALGRLYDRAFAFTRDAKALWRTRLERTWEPVEPAVRDFLPELPFAPLELAREDLAALVASCEVDHAVGPVHHTQGGSVAGERRWASFLEHRLGSYARDRNDPNRPGASRMSAYLHYGHVSPFRLAREANAHRTEGAQKYLDELLTWRELSWNLCAFQPHHGDVAALPEWAHQTLSEHERDPRPALPSWDTLARAQTDDPLWDAAQHQLLTNGELHNNVRMTWGKALLQWTANARDALALLVDLNHRYALDGRDPASYGGILWCLGALDRPFTPESPITGKVRARPLAEHARRLDVGEYSRTSRKPSRGAPLVVAVVGAGVAGAAAARALRDAGHVVRAFDKGRGPGGRCATRRDDEGGTFDHGAQYLTARDERFLRVVRSLLAEGVLERWEPPPKVLPERGGAAEHALLEDAVRGGASAVLVDEAHGGASSRLAAETARGAAAERAGGSAVRSPGEGLTLGRALGASRASERFVGVGGMNELLKRLLRDTEVRYGAEVTQLERLAQRFRLHGKDGPLGEFDAVVVAAPAPQAQALLQSVEPQLAARAGEAVMAPCWSVMATFPGPLPVPLESAFLNAGPLGFVARQASRPGQAPGERWVLQATAAWSRAHLERDAAEVGPLLCEAFAQALGVALEPPRALVAHRWRFARVERPLGVSCLWSQELGLASAGDWCLGERIEDAFLSGCAAAGRINQLSGETPEAPPAARRAAQLLLGLG